MKEGIIKLIESIGFSNGEKIFEDTVNPYFKSSNINFLFTQMLCMISHNGGSEAPEVEKILKKKEIFIKQANDSLTGWYKRITQNLKEKGTILLMGKEAMNLLKNAWVNNNGYVLINFAGKPNQCSSSLSEALSQHFHIFNVYHASAFRRKNSLKLWMKNGKRKETYLHLIKQFPEIHEINYHLKVN